MRARRMTACNILRRLHGTPRHEPKTEVPLSEYSISVPIYQTEHPLIRNDLPKLFPSQMHVCLALRDIRNHGLKKERKFGGEENPSAFQMRRRELVDI